MGFGLLFLGYFAATMMSVNTLSSFFRIAGYIIVLIALLKLNKYHRSFKWAAFLSVFMIGIYSLYAAADISKMLYERLLISSQPFGDAYIIACGYIEMALSFVFHTALLNAIRLIAMETGVPKKATAAVRNLVFICVYNILYFLAKLPLDLSKYLVGPAVIIYFVYTFLNLLLIYSCYARICDEADVNMDVKPSRFAFVNKMRAESEQRRNEAARKRAENKKRK